MLLSLCLLFLGVRVGYRVPCLAASGCDLVLFLLCSGALPSVVCAGESGREGCLVALCLRVWLVVCLVCWLVCIIY